MTLKDFIEKVRELITETSAFQDDGEREGADIIIGIVDHDEQSTYLLGHGCAKCLLEYFNSSEDVKHTGTGHITSVH
jgi:hypothetical protein